MPEEAGTAKGRWWEWGRIVYEKVTSYEVAVSSQAVCSFT